MLHVSYVCPQSTVNLLISNMFKKVKRGNIERKGLYKNRGYSVTGRRKIERGEEVRAEMSNKCKSVAAVFNHSRPGVYNMVSVKV